MQVLVLKKFVQILSVLFVLQLVFLPGCARKKKVVYIPKEISTNAGRSGTDTRSDSKSPEAGTTVLLKEPVKKRLVQHFTAWQGTRYRRGGKSRKGMDCSGFVQLTYEQLFHKNLPRTVRGQVTMGSKVSRRSLLPGDLVFFKTGMLQKHVGIFLEKDSFMHVSQSRGLVVSSLRNRYWRGKYWQSRRLL